MGVWEGGRGLSFIAPFPTRAQRTYETVSAAPLVDCVARKTNHPLADFEVAAVRRRSSDNVPSPDRVPHDTINNDNVTRKMQGGHHRWSIHLRERG